MSDELNQECFLQAVNSTQALLDSIVINLDENRGIISNIEKCETYVHKIKRIESESKKLKKSLLDCL